MSVEPTKLKKVSCPNCSTATKLLWARKNSYSSIPLCKACFFELKKRSAKKASKYKVYFLPNILHPDPEKWIVSSERQYEFRELKHFIDYCLDPQNIDSKTDNFITKDKDSLLQLIDSLFSLIPDIFPQSIEEFKKVNEPQIPSKTPKQKRKVLIETWEIQAKPEYERYLQMFKKAHQKEYETIELRQRIATRLRDEVQHRYGKYYLKGAKKVFWRMLPPGKHSFADILNHLRNTQRDNSIRYDEERLEKIYSLGPTSTYIGTDEFKGYVAFYFEDLQIAVLDCHKVGNAIYVMDKDWQSLSQLSKDALRTTYPGKIERIIHADNWYQKLRSFLYVHGWRPQQ